jgi:aspartyl-tRNA(Asn)/glutamyl-tRNA(Gln) amidotransferase subunit A
LDSDSGGSIRHPAALCGVVGLLPTRGRVSRKGIMRSSPSLDAAGPMARNVRDCAALFAVVTGSDPADPATVKRPFASCDSLWGRSLRNRRIVVPKDKLLETLQPAVHIAFAAAVRAFTREGLEVATIDLPDWDGLNAITAIVFAAEVAALHRRSLAADPDAYLPEVRERMAAGFLYPAVDYIDALRMRARLTRAFVKSVFAGADVLLLPSATYVAPRLDEVLPGAAQAREYAGLHTLAAPEDPGRFTRAFNYLGLPALALPAGFSPDGLPIGVQIVGPPFAEAVLFEFGHGFQRVTDHHLHAPTLETDDTVALDDATRRRH